MPVSLKAQFLLGLVLAHGCLQIAQATCIQPTAAVPENLPVGSLIARYLTEPPASFTPTIGYPDGTIQSQFECYFFINRTGVYVNRTVDLEMPASCAGGNITDMTVVQLTVQCSPGSSAILIVLFSPVNEFKPFFLTPEYSFSLSESTPVDTVVVTLRGQVDDKDVREDKDFNFAIQSGATSFFTMDRDGRTSGTIRVNRTLDYDAGSEYREFRLNISATPLTAPPGHVAYAVVKISVTDFDDLSPQFTQDTYRFSFVENDISIINRSLDTTPKFLARDMDFGINQIVRYKIQSGASVSGQPFLEIDEVTGQFRVIRIIDRETLSSNEILLQVKAYQTDKPDTRIALATVIVTVLDKNDNRPTISPTALNTSIAENSAAGTYVTRLGASDLDMNSTVEFVLIDATGAFQIDAGSGVVTVRNSSLLDREAVPSFSFMVFAREMYTAEQYQSDNATVLVTLADVNDNSPLFGAAQYNFNVSEAAPLGTLIGQVNATDRDARLNGVIKFSLTHASGNGLTVMSLDPNTGVLSLTANLSAANPAFVASYQLVVTATDQAVKIEDRRVNSVIVQVTIVSSRSWPPVFTRPLFAVNVTEASPVGTEVARLTATDRDPDTVLTYSLLAGSGGDKFLVVSSGNEGLVRVAAPLDRETVGFYNMTATVSDGAMTGTAQVEIRLLDFNDNAPRFNSTSGGGFNFTVLENLPAGAPVGKVTAFDADEANSANSALTYSLLGNQAAAFFSINASSGEIVTKVTIDREQTAAFSFPVLASDEGTPRLSSTADIFVQVLDVNDNAPEFDSSVTSSVALPENSRYVDFLQLKFIDPDLEPNRESRFGLLAPSDLSGAFVVNSSTGFLSSTVALTRSLFRNNTRHNLSVLVYNVQPLVGPAASESVNRTRVITVTLLDTNDNRPVFVQSLFEATVPENWAIGPELVKVTANDKDSTVPYSTIVYNITGGNGLGKFRLDSNTGSLSLRQGLNFDTPDFNTNFSIQVMAYNPVPDPTTGAVLNDTAQVLITVTDVNDNEPVFAQAAYEFEINETLPVGTSIGSAIRASDNDSSSDAAFIAYELRPAVGLPFNVSVSGVLQLAAPVSRDDGGPAAYSFQIAAVNRRASPQLSGVASVSVRILGVNNNPPLFGSGAGGYNFSVAENQRAGSTVGAVTATDRDGDSLEYTVLGTDLFSVQAGGLLVTQTIIDRERLVANPVAFVVQAFDGLHRTNASVLVDVSDVNDNAPKFSPAGAELAVSVLEAAPNGSLVTMVNVTDADSGQNANVTFAFLGSGNSPAFSIDALSGRVTVANSRELDYQKQPEHSLIVSAADGGSPSLTSFQTLRVRIIDTNDKPVTFSPSAYSATVMENQRPPQLAVRVFASDADTVPAGGFNFSLADSAADAATFYLTDFENTKSASLMVRATLDRENRSFYSVRLNVTDGRFFDTAVVNVTVGDVNDNEPTFSASDYAFFADELTPAGAVIGRVAAVDSDAGANAQLVYFLAGGEENFRLDFRNGELSLAAAGLNASLKSVYRMAVTARDQGSPSLSASANVTVYVNATNRFAPVFGPAVYNVVVNETAAVGVVIATVVATDADYPSVNGRLTFSLAPPADAHFEIDSSSGAIRLKSALDYETTQSHQLVVMATDGGAMPRSATAQVFVSVLNADDTAPRFAPTDYSFLAPENSTAGWRLGFATALDPDFPGARPQPISYSVLPNASFIQINSTTGQMSLASGPTLPVGNYSATIVATDAARQTASAPVLLRILPAAFYYAKVPSLPASPLTVPAVLENQTDWLNVANVDASINGGAPDSGVFYRLAAGGDKFNVSADSGLLSARPRTLDRETASDESAVVVAVNAAEPAYSASVLISLSLNDINDNEPRFQFPAGDCLVLENATVGSVVADAVAVDPDVTAGAPSYTLVSDSSSGKFRLQSGPGNLARVLVNATLDYDTMAAVAYRYFLIIQASDGKFTSNYSLTVRIGDVNDNPPKFSASSYSFSLAEMTPVGEVVGQVSAVDPDTADNTAPGGAGSLSRLVYSLGPPAASASGFIIDSVSGVVSTAAVFNRLVVSRVTFNVTCQDTAGHVDIAHVTVVIQDVNNHSPNITNLPNTWRVAENFSSSVGQAYNLTVQDLDEGQNANVSLTIVSGNERGWFSIVDGFRLTAANNIDREAPGLAYDSAGNGLVTLVVMATDAGAPNRRSSTGVLTVLIGDINDSPPRFAAGTMNRQFQLAESTAIGSVVVPGFDALDNDLATSNSFVYRLGSEGNFNDTFEMTSSGSLRLTKPLSRAAKAEFNLTILLTDGVFNVSTYITIIVMDSNNNSPVFTSPVYEFSVTENDNSGLTGQLIGQVRADDPDTGLNGKVVYSVSSPSNYRHLLAISENGTVTLNGTVDREANSFLVFTIVASDMGVSPRFTTAELRLTVLDINDNQPAFTAAQYTGTVAENSPAGTEVYFLPSLQATDRDAEGNNSYIEFSIVGDLPSLPFVINASTGRLTVAPGASLDRESSSAEFTFTVAAFNSRGQPSTLNRTEVGVTVRLSDINDNSPTFASGAYNFNLSEAASQFASVGRVSAADPDAGDNGTVMYFIASGSDSRFVININTGEIQLIYPIDRETKDFYLLNVSAVDRGSPGLSSFVGVAINVLDVNDVAPTFQPAASVTFVLTEGATGVVGQLKATDGDLGDNARLTYFLNDSAAMAAFSLNASDGLLTTKGTSGLDREATPVIRFLAFTRDAGSPVSLTGTTEVTVRLADINDNSPVFAQSEFRVYTVDDSPVNSILLVAMATDRDEGPNANLTYSLLGNGSDFVTVESAMGFVKIAKQLTLSELLNRDLVRRNGTGNHTGYTPLTLELQVFDNPTDLSQPRRNATAPLLIFLNQVSEQLPRFSQVNYRFSLPENSSPGSFVGAVNATLPSGSAFSVKYRLLNDNPLFAVDEATGNITVRPGAWPDRENSSQTPHLVATVMAFTDSTPSRQAFSVVLVTLTDVNDNQPRFAYASYAFAAVEGTDSFPARLGFVSASDADLGANAAVSYAIRGDAGGQFAVNPGTGEVTTVKPLDREAGERRAFQIVATDGGTPAQSATVDVVVIVEDVNDNPPSMPTQYSANVTEGLPADTLVTIVTAVDADRGLNSTIGFRLSQTEVPPMFYLQPDGAGNASLRTLGRLDYDIKNLYSLVLVAFDLGNPSLSSTATLSVTVQRLDRSVPRFHSAFYNASLPDNLAPGTPVFNIPAGSGPTSFNYSLGAAGNINNAFAVNSQGQVSTNRLLGNLPTRVYTLNVTARNSAGNAASTSLQLWLLAPTSAVFPQTRLSLVWPEAGGGPGRTQIYDFDTTDESMGRTVRYSIDSCSASACLTKFELDSASGQLYLKSELDRETVSNYSLVVRATLSGAPASGRKRRAAVTPLLSNSVTLALTVADVNDNPPVFSAPTNPYAVGLVVGAPVNSLVYTLQATDRDLNSTIRYSLANETDRFYVDPVGGQLRTKVTFSTVGEVAARCLATDGVFNTSLDLRISLLDDVSRLVLTTGITPDRFRLYEALILRNLSGLLAADLRIEKFESSVSGVGSEARVDPSKTDAYLYAYNPSSGALLSQAELRARVEARRAEIVGFFASLGATFDGVRSPSDAGVNATTTSTTTTTARPTVLANAGLSSAEVALIVLGVLFFMAAVACLAVLCWLCKRKAQRRKQILAAGGDREGIVGATGLKANGSAASTAATAPSPLAAMYRANNPAYKDADSVVGNSREQLVAKKQIHGLYQSAPSATDSLRSGDNVTRFHFTDFYFDDKDEDGNPIIIVNSGQQQPEDEMLEDAWLAAATNREPTQPQPLVQNGATARHGDTPAMQISVRRRTNSPPQQQRQFVADGDNIRANPLPPLPRPPRPPLRQAPSPLVLASQLSSGGDSHTWDLSGVNQGSPDRLIP